MSRRERDEPHYHECLPGQMDLEQYLAELPPRPAAGDNGGPSLEPCYGDLARIARPVFGDLWEGKLAPYIGEDPRTLRRWRAGEGRPSARSVRWAKDWAVRTALELLSAADEEELAGAVRRRQAAVGRADRERGRAMSLAKPPAPVASRPFVSLAKPPKVSVT